MEAEKVEKKDAPVLFHLTQTVRRKLRHLCIDRGESMDAFCADAVAKKLASIDKKTRP